MRAQKFQFPVQPTIATFFTAVSLYFFLFVCRLKWQLPELSMFDLGERLGDGLGVWVGLIYAAVAAFVGLFVSIMSLCKARFRIWSGVTAIICLGLLIASLCLLSSS